MTAVGEGCVDTGVFVEGNAHMLQEEVFSGFVVISILFALALNIIWFVVVVVLIEKLPLYFY